MAVREMNVALKEWSAAHSYATPADVTDVAAILAERGYNASNWITLTANYRVYWCQARNEMVLYNYVTTEVEYPDGYTTDDMLGKTEIGKTIYIFNAAQLDVPYVALTLSSTSGSVSAGDAEFVSSMAGISQTQISNGVVSASESSNLTKVSNMLASSETRTELFGSSSNVYVYGTKELTSGGTDNYASMQVFSVGKETTANAEFTNSGDVRENFYYLSIYGDKTDPVAQKAAGNYVFNLFSKIAAGSINDDVTIVLEPGLTVDCSEVSEWTPVKTFSGYFGSTDSTAAGKVSIKNISLTSQTGFAQTVHFDGTKPTGSHYYVTGIFGVIYGNATIENLTFSNVTIKDPALDATTHFSDAFSRNRNTVALIGGITDGSNTDGDHVANVLVKGITIDNTCSFEGFGCVGGLVGYIGAADAPRRMDGKVTIENCSVSAKLHSTYISTTPNDYGVVGGLISYTLRTTPTGSNVAQKYYDWTGTISNLNPAGAKYYCPIYINNCTVSATISGGNKQGAACAYADACIVFQGSNNFSGATLNGKRDDGELVNTYILNNRPSTIVKIEKGATITYSNYTVFNTCADKVSSGVSSSENRYIWNGNLNYSGCSSNTNKKTVTDQKYITSND